LRLLREVMLPGNRSSDDACSYPVTSYSHSIATRSRRDKMAFTIMGYTVTNAEQARSVLMVAKLAGRAQVVAQCLSLIRQYEAA
jgi:arginine repressor